MSLIRVLLAAVLALSGLLHPAEVHSATYLVDQASAAASDTNPGSTPRPLKSIAAAAARAVAGDTILIAGGTYRETIPLSAGGTAGRPLTLRALPGAMVTIKGSDRVSGWTRLEGNVWKKERWPVNSQQLFVDGIPLQQIGSSCPLSRQQWQGKPLLPSIGSGLADLRPGCFFYAPSRRTLFVQLADNGNPNLHMMEASVRDFIIPLGETEHVTLQDLHFAHSNLTSKGLNMGMVNVGGEGWTVNGCSFSQGDFCGLAVTGRKHRIRHCRFNGNGNLGLGINGSDQAHRWGPVPDPPSQDILLSDNETSHNNYRRFDPGWQGGGLKAAVSCRGLTITRHTARSNQGAGIWLDTRCREITISRCNVVANLVGIACETSDQAFIIRNLVIGSSFQGIYVSASNQVIVDGNTLDDNGWGIVLHGLPRSEHPELAHNRVQNNIIAHSRRADLVLAKGPVTADNRSDYNLYFRAEGGVKIAWSDGRDYLVSHTSLDQFRRASGQERHSLTADPLWQDRAAGHYQLRRDSPARGAGRELSAEEGRRGERINIGAF